MPRDDGATAINVAYLGPEASFSHQAAIAVFPPRPTSSSSGSSTNSPVTLHPLPTFPNIFSAIQAASSTDDEIQYDYAVVPIENSTNGSVVGVFDLFAQCGLDSSAPYPDIEVCAEYYLPVHHCLFISPDLTSSTSDRGPVPDPVSAIRTLYTHPQVWGQCTRFLSSQFPPAKVERIDVGSTSAAAQLVARESNGGLSAAIGSKLAGEKHKLTCLAENIEDEPGSNTTRFLVVKNRKRKISSDALLSYLSSSPKAKGEVRNKSLITFTISHTKPGALADALAVFKTYSFNLTSIDTRPSRMRNWQYVFFVECEQTADVTDSNDAANFNGDGLKRMLADLERYTESLRYLGTFEDQLLREEGDTT
ncbi:prephenate dehydratase [Knufia peltigerae]|uniref:prephenate dehydratase n=1 Tax=Knufia peltigerae TaxID=1002370 RepID=A0AA39CS59_9EURO|nr:prephenate dehydratase [Knufia peltigerae]